MRCVLDIVKALDDESRLRVLCALKGRELCACQIVELLGLAQSTVSKHMALLKQAGLVEARKDGRWVYYRLPRKGVEPAARRALHWVHEALVDDEAICEDTDRLDKILTCDPEAICRKQNRN